MPRIRPRNYEKVTPLVICGPHSGHPARCGHARRTAVADRPLAGALRRATLTRREVGPRSTIPCGSVRLSFDCPADDVSLDKCRGQSRFADMCDNAVLAREGREIVLRVVAIRARILVIHC